MSHQCEAVCGSCSCLNEWIPFHSVHTEMVWNLCEGEDDVYDFQNLKRLCHSIHTKRKVKSEQVNLSSTVCIKIN